MNALPASQLAPRPLEAGLTPARDCVDLRAWMPPRPGIAPQIQIGRRWITIWWAIPVVLVLLVVSVAAATALRTIPAVQEFIARYPGTSPTAPLVLSGFPVWLRLQHYFNIIFMMLILRAGIQILADHPRLFWGRDSTPGTEWFRFAPEVPKDPAWTSKDDSVSVSKWLGIPGLRHTVGLARWWHFVIDLVWTLNGVIFFVLLFTTDQWRRIIPTQWAVFPNALSTGLQYLSLRFPADQGWTYYNGLQQLTYFVTVFIAAPLAILTGLLQAPAVGNRLGALSKVLNRQVARSVHFLVLCWFLLFILIHVSAIFATGMLQNLNHMFAGVNNNSWEGFFIFLGAMAIVAALWIAVSPFTLSHARLVQNVGKSIINPLKGLAETWNPGTQFKEKDISSYFWVNGTLPKSEEFNALVQSGFAGYTLKVGGLVENPREFSFEQLKALPKQEQITQHFCIQGWSGVAKWGGVSMRQILDIIKPTREARYAVFYSFAEGAEGGTYYDVHSMRNMRHASTLLAYEMNGAPLNVPHGAPLRLRVENELGFKMVKWIRAIEFVHDYAHLGAGQGGYNEDHEFYGNRMPI